MCFVLRKLKDKEAKKKVLPTINTIEPLTPLSKILQHHHLCSAAVLNHYIQIFHDLLAYHLRALLSNPLSYSLELNVALRFGTVHSVHSSSLLAAQLFSDMLLFILSSGSSSHMMFKRLAAVLSCTTAPDLTTCCHVIHDTPIGYRNAIQVFPSSMFPL